MKYLLAIKNWQETSLVYHTNRTIRITKRKLKQKTDVQYRIHEGSPIGGTRSMVGRINAKVHFESGVKKSRSYGT